MAEGVVSGEGIGGHSFFLVAVDLLGHWVFGQAADLFHGHLDDQQMDASDTAVANNYRF